MAVQLNQQDLIARAYALQQQAQQAEQLRQQEAAAAQAEAQRQAELNRSRTFGEVAQDAGLQLLDSAVGLGQAAYGVANIATVGDLDRLTQFSQNFAETRETTAGLRTPQTQARLQELQQTFAEGGVGAGLAQAATTPALLQELVLSNAASLIPGAAAARGAGAAAAAQGAVRGLSQQATQRLAQQAAERAVLRTTGAQTAGAVNVEALNAIREAGGTENQAQLGALGAAGLAGIAAPLVSRFTGAAGFEAQAARALGAGAVPGAVGGIVRPIVTGAGREAAEEALQSGTEQLSQNIFTPGAALGQDVGQAAALGGLTGGILGGGMGGVIAAGPRRPSQTREQLQREILQADRELNGTLAPSVLGDAFDANYINQRRAEVTPASASAFGALRAGLRREDLLGGAPQPGAAADVPLASQAEAIAQRLFRTELDENNQLRFFRYNSNLQREEEVPAQAALATAASVIERGRVLQEQQRAQRELPSLLPQVTEETGPTDVEEITLTDVLPQMQVEELPFGDADLAALQPPLPTVEFDTGPQRTTEIQPAAQVGPTWKQFLARDLDVKPAALRGKTWNQLIEAAEAAGVQPSSPEAAQFLSQQVSLLGQDRERAPEFIARLAEKYPAAPRQGTLQEALALTEDEYIQAVNPTGKRTAEDDIVIVRAGELDLPTGAQLVETFNDSAGNPVNVFADAAGSLYAEQNGEVLGQIENRDGETLNIVTQEAQGRGVGTGLATALIRRDPFAQAGSFSPAGEATRRAAFRRLQAEQTQGALVELNADSPEPAPQTAGTPGSPAEEAAPPVGIDATIEHERQAGSKYPEMAAMIDILEDAPDTDLLDEYYLAMKRHPVWQTMPAVQRQQVSSYYQDRFHYLDGSSPGRFDRAVVGDGNAMSEAEFAAAINFIGGRVGNTPIMAHSTVADFEATHGLVAPHDARGVFAGGTVHLIRENMPDKKTLATVLAHERGHAGLAQLLGDRLTAATNRMWANARLRRRIQSKQDDLGLNRAVAAEEVLADMLAGGETLTGDVQSKLRSGVNQFFADVLGYGDLVVSDAEVDELLRDVALVIRGHAVNEVQPQRPEVATTELKNLMGSPAQFTAGEPRFSRATTTLESAVEDAKDTSTTSDNKVLEVSKDVAQASLDKLKGLQSFIKDGGIKSALLDATPLSQLVNLYGSKLPKLAEFARLKRRKENAHNKTLTGKLKGSYAGKEREVTALDTAKRWDKFRRRNPGKGRALDAMNQYGTLYHVFPDRAWDDQAEVDYARLGFSEAQRRKVWSDLRQIWHTIGTEGQTIFADTQAVYSAMWNRQFSALKAERERVNPGSTAFASVIDTALQRLKTGPYSPLQRVGNYLVTVRDTSGKTVWFSGHDNGAEADAMIAELRDGEFRDASKFRTTRSLRADFSWSQAGIDAQAVAQIEGAVEAALPGSANAQQRSDVVSTLLDAYLASLPQQSFLQYANQRSGVAGVPTNSFRAFSDYVQKGARRISGIQFDGQISSSLAELQTAVDDVARGRARDAAGQVEGQEQGGQADVVDLQRVVNAVKAQHDASLKYEASPVADLLSSAGFLWFMTSPSQMLINATQTIMVTIPRLAGTYGSSKALKQTKDALGAYARSSGDLLGAKSKLSPQSAEYQVLNELRERGTLDFTLTHDIANMGEGSLSAMSGHWRAAMNVASSFIHKSEVFNRQVVALAAVRLEMEKRGWTSAGITDAQRQQLSDIAEDAVISTQFDYSQSNKPPLLQGPYRRLVFQFQQYRLNMLAMMAKDIRDSLPTTIAGREIPGLTYGSTPEEKATARRALAWMLGTQLAMTGAAGTVLAPFVFAIMDAFRDDDDLLDSRTEFVRAAPQWLAHGLVSQAFNIDLGRVGSDTLVPILGESAYAPVGEGAQETVSYYLTRNLGPWFGLVNNFAGGFDAAMNGDHVRAFKNLAPKPFADAYTAAFEYAEGAKDTRQIVYFEPGVWDGLTSVAGLRSTDRREIEETRGASYRINATANALSKRALNQLALGYSTGDVDLVTEAQGSIARFNEQYPDIAITGSDIRRAVVARSRAEINAAAFGIATSRTPSSTEQELLNLR